jgi:hypothetical protein
VDFTDVGIIFRGAKHGPFKSRDQMKYIFTSRAFSLLFFFRNSDLFLLKSKISARTDLRNLSRTINGNVDSQGAPSVPSQTRIRRNFTEHHQTRVQNGLT